jgi:hypothetical protein
MAVFRLGRVHWSRRAYAAMPPILGRSSGRMAAKLARAFSWLFMRPHKAMSFALAANDPQLLPRNDAGRVVYLLR